ncbi:MAG: phenylalanine--tRNA ligase subunit beta [Chlorobi bacterium]|nr:phenylalanine--tRNA ligase subunit beta [Chlorobiota bacterium]
MKLSYNWLKQYVDIDVDPLELSDILTNIGLEVEGMEKFQSVKGGLEGVVIGKVITCEKHPNADKLSVTTVDVGGGKILPIVCGAPNVEAGQTVPVATVGTVLYSEDESFTIKKTKIRGEVSEGMICAEDELGLGTSHEGIMVLPDELQPGTPASEYFNIEEDYVYEIGLTPNRADAASHIGSARDVAAGLNRIKNTRKYKLLLPSVEDFKVDDRSLDIDVVVEDTRACPRYSGVTISGVKVEESPDWLKNKLNAIGLRPINNIVDITNYILHETGQPLHPFDADKIKGNKVVVKKMPEGTPFVTLDGVERKLADDDLMICNAEEGMCIGGVFGGRDSGVTEQTTNIFLESAYFDPAHIRKTSKLHGLQTDASFRFERGADPEMTLYALKRATMLFREIAGGKISSEIKDVYPEKIEKWTVDITYKNVDRLIGKVIDRNIIKDILTDLEIEVLEENGGGMKLLIPTFKVDVKREADVIEEILRVYGYNNVEFEDKIDASVSYRQKPDAEKVQNLISDQLTAQGFVEIINNSLTRSEYYIENEDFDGDKSVPLLNPLSKDLDVLRQSLLFGGLEVISYNINRKMADQKLYEFGKIYSKDPSKDMSSGLKKYHEEKHLSLLATGAVFPENWNNDNRKVDFYFLKGIVEGIFLKLGINRSLMEVREISSNNYAYGIVFQKDGKTIAEITGLSKKLLRRFDIEQEVFMADLNWEKVMRLHARNETVYAPVSKYPSVRRDLALLVDKSVRFEEMEKLAFETERKILKKTGLFDVYEGEKIPEGKKSYALSFILQDEGKTLTDKVIDKTMKRIRQAFEQKLNAELR